MKNVTAVALIAVLVAGVSACSETGPSAPLATNPPAPPSPPPVTPGTSVGRIAYVDGGTVTLINSDGSKRVPLVAGWSPDWSPDGKRIIFSNTICDTDWYSYFTCLSGGLVVIDPETGETTNVPNGALGDEPAWSPDGELIAFVRHELPGGLLVMRQDGSEQRQFKLPLVYDAFEPSWSRDGKRLTFQCMDGSGSGVCVINLDGTGFARLTAKSDYAASPAWSPKSDKIAFQFWNLQRDMGEIALMADDGSGVTRIVDGYSPIWSRDATKLVFSGKAGGLFISNSDGTNVTRLTDSGASPAWRP